MKVCSRCNKELELNQFVKDKNRKDGLCCYCIICQKKYRIDYKEQIKEYHKEWRKNHKAQIKESNLKYVKEHKEELTEHQQKYQKTPKSIFAQIKYRSKRKDIEINITEIDFVIWYNNQKQICHYCKRTLKEIKQNTAETKRNKKCRLTIDRKDNCKGYDLNNIVLACNRCNMTKSNYFTEQEMLEIGKIIKNRK